MAYDNKGKEFYYSVELSKREKELEELKKDFENMAKAYRRTKKTEIEVE